MITLPENKKKKKKIVIVRETFNDIGGGRNIALAHPHRRHYVRFS